MSIDVACATCGSRDVSRDAWGDWDSAKQQWVLRTVFDYAFCHACDGECRLIDIPLDPTPAAVELDAT